VKKLALTTALLIQFAGFCFSVDFGLLVEQKIEAENDIFTYTPGFGPWFSWNGEGGVSLYLSGLFQLPYHNYSGSNPNESGFGDPAFVPELTRSSLGYRANQRFYIEAGRVQYADALGLTASGIFDGLRFEAVLPSGVLSVGAYYTGLLYKESAKILMTGEDFLKYAEPWDYGDFGNYFASRRFFGVLGWNVPILEFHSLSLELLAQFDVNGKDEFLHSQYGEILFEFFAGRRVVIHIGGILEVLEGKDDFAAGFGGLARFGLEVPGSLDDNLQFSGKFGSGRWNESFYAFVPVTSAAQGAVFPGTISGLVMASVDYSARFHHTLLAQAGFSYFMRTYEDPDADGSRYGGEFRASVIWQPLDDIRLNLGGGAFFPGMGDVYPSNTDTMWKITAALSVSL